MIKNNIMNIKNIYKLGSCQFKLLCLKINHVKLETTCSYKHLAVKEVFNFLVECSIQTILIKILSSLLFNLI